MSEFCYFILGVALSSLISWLVTHVYYKKSLNQQAEASSSQINSLAKVVESANRSDPALLKQKRIEECLLEYKRAGTPVRVIDTYSDMSNTEKAEVLDTVLLRARGRPAKKNKYRE